jgi:hypoxia up-regulated 1
MLMDSEDWLYDQSDDSEDPFVEKLNELRDISDPIFLRAHEFDLRPKALSEAERIINYTRNMLDQFKTERPWIPEEDRTTLEGKIDKLDTWLANKTAEQQKLELTDKPAFMSSQLIDKLRPIAKLGSFHLRVWQ